VGPRTVRIARDEILTPPEFAGREGTNDPASRIGGAALELYRDGTATRLGYCYQQIPLSVMPPFQFDTEPAALLYFINLTAGLMDGDAHLIDVVARAGTRALVTGQSATRVHPASHGFATQQWTVRVEDDACLVVLPGPTIPFQGCRYFQRGRAELAPTARLLWGDIWLAGRYDRGALSERFAFDQIVQDFAVRRGEALLYRERFSWHGPWRPAEAQWYFGGHLAAGSLLVAGPVPPDLPAARTTVRRAVLPLDTGVTCLRWCGHPTEVTSELVSTALSLAASWTCGEAAARPWFIASGELAPNHWFSPGD
jgi:urease accessory protein